MNVEIITIGNEILSGRTVNTNLSYLAKELEASGFIVSRETTLPDKLLPLQEGLKEALSRSSLVIAMGGLGPTLDDVTRNAAASLFNSPFSFFPEVADDLKRRFGSGFATVEDQATLPTKAKPFLNPLGTAPGLLFEENHQALLLLPGVPHEMKALLACALPYLVERFRPKSPRFKKELHFFNLFEKDVDPDLRTLAENYPQVTFGIYPALGTLGCTLTAATKEDLEAPVAFLTKKFSDHLFEGESLEEAVHRKWIQKGWTLALAESCTGGEAAARLTKIAGASKFFLGSFVTYSNELKTAVLDVPSDLIAQFGAVSREVVEAMCLGALVKSGATHALAVSGIAGPDGGSDERPLGTVWFSVCRRGEAPHSWKVKGKGSREMVIEYSVNQLLSGLLMYER